MALTRRMLKAMSIDDEKIDQIIDAHTETIDEIKNERDQYKAEAEKLPDIQRKLDKALADASDLDTDAWKIKYDELKTEYDDFKSAQVAKELKASKETAYKLLLKDAGISEKRIDSVLKVSDLDAVTLSDDGKIVNADKLIESIKSEWSDFITSTSEHGADTAAPPSNTGVSTFESMSLAEKMTYANANPTAPEVVEWLNK